MRDIVDLKAPAIDNIYGPVKLHVTALSRDKA